eukprot:2077837-Prymnesium_polylepis.1
MNGSTGHGRRTGAALRTHSGAPRKGGGDTYACPWRRPLTLDRSTLCRPPRPPARPGSASASQPAVWPWTAAAL